MAVDSKDYYKILGVDNKADQKEIQKAYRKLARQYHPDVNPGDRSAEERFKEINEANEVLSDPEKRQRYDELRSYHQQYGRWPGAEAGGAGRRTHYRTVNVEDLHDIFGGTSPFSDFFETYFGSGFAREASRARQPARQNIDYEVEVTLAEAYQGITRVFELAEPDGNTRRRLEVKIPAGVEDGTRIRIVDQGPQGPAGRGDLYLRVHVMPDTRFTRDGTTLRTRIDVPLVTAMLGGEVQVPTPDRRRLLLRVPPETPNGKVFRLRGQGMPTLNQPDRRGDLYAETTIVLPTRLNAEQRRLFEAFARAIDRPASEREQRHYG